MPRGDGSGPFGKGPLNRLNRGKRAAGRNQNCLRNPDSSKRFIENKPLFSGLGLQNDSDAGYLSRIPALIIKMLTIAIPIFMKVQKQIQDSKGQKRIDFENTSSSTVTIEAEKGEPADDATENKQLSGPDK